jgi:GH24 family phage-related lysozyme (muramidase)
LKLFNTTIDNLKLKQNISKLLIIYYLSNFVLPSDNLKLSQDDIKLMKTELSENSFLNKEELKNFILRETKYHKSKKFKNPNDLKITNRCINLIKKSEKLKLVAYDLHDGKITVGYGHAEPKSTSKYKVGQKISEKEADELLYDDIAVAANGIKRMFNQWSVNGDEYKITQTMFDSMVSLAFNIGITGLRNTDFIDYVKDKEYKKAAEKIKTTKLKDGFGGLIARRAQEYALFNRDLS